MRFQLLVCQICFTCNSSRLSKPPSISLHLFFSPCTSHCLIVNVFGAHVCRRMRDDSSRDLFTHVPRASGIFVDGCEAEKRGYHSPPTVIWSRGGGQNGHVLARGGERSAGFPAYSSEGLSVCLGGARKTGR